MSIFGNSNKCKKFFTYETRTLDIKGLSTIIGAEKVSAFNLGIGEISIKPYFLEASQKLQELDLLQFSICKNIQQLKDSDTNKAQLLKQLIETQIEMLKIAQNPEKSFIANSTKDNQNDNLKKNSEFKDKIENCIEQGNIKDALQYLKSILKERKNIVLFISQYNDLDELIKTGRLTKISPEYKDFIARFRSYFSDLDEREIS
jgi:hypothetical protein